MNPCHSSYLIAFFILKMVYFYYNFLNRKKRCKILAFSFNSVQQTLEIAVKVFFVVVHLFTCAYIVWVILSIFFNSVYIINSLRMKK
jgi:flagellar biosynthesis protein FlhB